MAQIPYIYIIFLKIRKNIVHIVHKSRKPAWLLAPRVGHASKKLDPHVVHIVHTVTNATATWVESKKILCIAKKICYTISTNNPQRNIMRTASWIIVNKATGAAVFETFNENTARAVNVKLYEAIPALQYLQQLNRNIKEAQK